MKVLYLSHHFHTESGNFSSRPFLFAKELVAKGHHVTVVSGLHDRGALEIKNGNASQIRRTSTHGIDIIQVAVPYANRMSVLKRAAVFLRYTWECIIQAVFGDYELVFATSGPLTVGIPGILAKLLRGKTFVLEIRDLLPESPRALGLVKNPLALTGMKILESLSYTFSEAIIALAPGALSAIQREVSNSKPLALLPNGSELETFYKRSREELEISGIALDDTVAIFTGAHGIANGLHAILDAAKEVIKLEKNDIKFVFFGDGKIKPELNSRIREENITNCFLFDPIPKPELAKILGSADVGLMVLQNIPVFHYSTSPNKFFDYLSSGLPIITNYPGWVADLITEHDSGIAVPPNSPKAFAKAITRYADDSKLRARHGNNSRLLAESNFDMKKISLQFVQFLEKIAKAPSDPVL